VQDTLEALIAREVVAAQPRRPGQKEQRYLQLLGDDGQVEAAEPAKPGAPSLEERVSRLETEVAALREELGG
jgi:uncharacterized protein YceH (UPF0502 family)